MKRATRQMIVAASLLLCTVMPAASYAQLQGALFTTPEQRAYLNALRRDFRAASSEQGFDIEDSEVPPLPEETADAPPQRIEYTLSGIMTRRDGSHIIWLNNRSYTDQELPEGVALVTTGNALALRFRTNSGERLLLPGQTLEINSGEVQERYQRTAPASTAEDDDQP